ncbi:DUF3311 domain-containing protein [Aneurinibacillus migulanus]|uniref:DUF3311 domain-containing protein n=1 Tax=Aneurinibacillus migulanus TaxID=47500 RepID=UPI0009BB2A31|nr:DUF3311 domain-containing protein [Aneurinibacillus migulanus]MED0892700.1 DUF3311 domain-containing protein [Aneurinibacillus migulanus]MED1614341.1 DUF3311 domain-containing protein [Aneurinibacillus migulanus]
MGRLYIKKTHRFYTNAKSERVRNTVSIRLVGSLIIGLVVPFVAIIGLFPITSRIEVSVLGFPFLYFWMFLWFGLTSVCLWISWCVFDRPYYVTESREKGE